MKIINMSTMFLTDVFKKRSVIYELAKRDFRQQYMGSYLGFVWMFLEPLLFVFVLYMVFSFGFRTGESGKVPFVLYLITGFISWLYFADNLSANTNVIRSYSFLVKKVDFRLSVLPIVTMLRVLVPHFFLLVVAVIILWFRGYSPSIYTIQIVYYLFAMLALLLGLGWLTSSTSIFVKDVNNLVRVMIQFGFWMTPIVWNIEIIPLEYRWIINLNPMSYIVMGYRDSLIFQVPFWHHPIVTFYFWTVTLIILICGISVYRKLKPHFAEVV